MTIQCYTHYNIMQDIKSLLYKKLIILKIICKVMKKEKINFYCNNYKKFKFCTLNFRFQLNNVKAMIFEQVLYIDVNVSKGMGYKIDV